MSTFVTHIYIVNFVSVGGTSLLTLVSTKPLVIFNKILGRFPALVVATVTVKCNELFLTPTPNQTTTIVLSPHKIENGAYEI